MRVVSGRNRLGTTGIPLFCADFQASIGAEFDMYSQIECVRREVGNLECSTKLVTLVVRRETLVGEVLLQCHSCQRPVSACARCSGTRVGSSGQKQGLATFQQFEARPDVCTSSAASCATRACPGHLYITGFVCGRSERFPIACAFFWQEAGVGKVVVQ